MDNIKVSILVPAFNVECYIEDCLRSLMSQTLEEIEIVIVDDGSTDSTGDIAEQYAVSDNRVRVYHQEHQGVAEARNKCLSLAQGEYIGFVDSDDYVSADAFEQLYLRAKAYSADIVLGSIMYCYEDGTTDQIGDKTIVFQNGIDAMDGKQCFKALIDTENYRPMICGNLYRTVYIHEYQLHFEAIFHEDEFFTPYAFYYARRVIDFKEDFYHYRQRHDSMMHNKHNIRERAKSLYFIGSKLYEFAKTVCYADRGMEEAYSLQADFLCERAQRLYEKELALSSRKCLYIFSESGVGAQYGIGTYIQQLIQCFSPSEWDVNIITLQTMERKVLWKMEENIACYEIPLPDKVWYTSSLEYEEKHYKSVFYYLSTRMPHTKKVYCHFNFFGYAPLAILCKEKWQAKVFFTLHYTDWSFDLLGDTEWLKRILSNPCGRKENGAVKRFYDEKEFMVNCCDCVIAIANHSYATLKDIYGIPEEKLTLIPNGIKDDYKERSRVECEALRRKYGFGKQEQLIIFAGRLDQVKGVFELIEAFKLLRKEMPDVKLVIAGSGNILGCLKNANPDWTHIMLTGFISKEQLYELYAIAQVGIVPSIHEEFGYVAVEMMMNKLPVVVNSTTGLKEIVENGKYGYTFDFGKDKDIQKLKKSLIQILTNKVSEDSLTANRNIILEKYSISFFREKINKLYDYTRKPHGIINN